MSPFKTENTLDTKNSFRFTLVVNILVCSKGEYIAFLYITSAKCSNFAGTFFTFTFHNKTRQSTTLYVLFRSLKVKNMLQSINLHTWYGCELWVWDAHLLLKNSTVLLKTCSGVSSRLKYRRFAVSNKYHLGWIYVFVHIFLSGLDVCPCESLYRTSEITLSRRSRLLS